MTFEQFLRGGARAGVLAVLAGLCLGMPVHSRADPADTWMHEAYGPFQKLLDRHLRERPLPGDGLVSGFDYAAALDDPDTPGLLQAQRALLAGIDGTALEERAVAIAFWINAYNYFMVDQILANPGRDGLVSGVRDYGTLLNPYRVFRRELFDVAGRRHSLDGIEKDILLGERFRELGWKEARVHFAVNCASVGCPPLRAAIYLPGTLESKLSEATRLALNTPRHLRVDGETLHLSSLFDWYADDFMEDAGSVEAFIVRHADAPVRAALQQVRRVRHIRYDWALNLPSNFPEFADVD
jgi:hypothetical protein